MLFTPHLAIIFVNLATLPVYHYVICNDIIFEAELCHHVFVYFAFNSYL